MRARPTSSSRRATAAVTTVLTAVTLCAAPLPAQQEAPRTTPERTDFAHTSTLAEVQAFVQALAGLPHGDRLTVTTFGPTHEGRTLPIVRCALPDAANPARLRALVIGNIHAGEVEGKEAIQVLLREIAQGEHRDLLAKVEVTFLPVYNGDGNERIDRKNRPEQNGPDGVGQRPNAQGFDLNRDFVKAESPECRALLQVFRDLDPHLFMDLHTTNGSLHGYHLTYAPCLSPNMDPALAELSAELLRSVRAGLAAAQPAWRVFDYGNFETRDWEGSGAPDSKGQKGWWTYDHRARYGINYFGLRNRIGVLSEAYSYCDFQTRIAATRAFVLATLGWLAAHDGAVLAACARADERCVQGNDVALGFATTFAPPVEEEVLVGGADRLALPNGLGTRLQAQAEFRQERMPVVRGFRARESLALPAAWALPAPPPAVVELLAAHGVRTTVLAEAREVPAAAFAVSGKRKPKRPFQGHQELELKGQWQPAAPRALPAGTLLIDARQPLARLAAQLLEPQSEDSLSTWNFLEQQTGDLYPVLRLDADAAAAAATAARR